MYLNFLMKVIAMFDFIHFPLTPALFDGYANSLSVRQSDEVVFARQTESVARRDLEPRPAHVRICATQHEFAGRLASRRAEVAEGLGQLLVTARRWSGHLA